MCAGMIACKLAAMSPSRVASLSLISTTSSGWHMLAGISREPWPAYLVSSHLHHFAVAAFNVSVH